MGETGKGTAAASDDPRPLPPEEPDAAACCGEGCVPCIYDRYDDALAAYREALAAWQARHPQAEDTPPDA